MAVKRSEAQLLELIRLAKQLQFHDDVEHWESELSVLRAATV